MDALQNLARQAQKPLAQIHALWTLHGLGGLSPSAVRQALRSPAPKVRSAAIRVSESLAGELGGGRLLSIWLESLNDVPEVQWQLALSLGEIQGQTVLEPLKTILERNLYHDYIPSAVLSSVWRRELEFLALLRSGGVWASGAPEAAAIVEKLAGAVFREGDASRIQRLLKFAAEPNEPEWRSEALLRGLRQAAFKKAQGKTQLAGDPILVSGKPTALETMAKSRLPALAALSNQLLEAFQWPGKAKTAEQETAAPLTPQQQARFEQGKELYALICGSCHQAHGRGQEGLAPSLLNSDWVLGSAERMTKIVLHGLQGPIVIDGEEWNLFMPGLVDVLDDEHLAAVMTYVRREWGHTASPVDPEFVAEVRAKYEGRVDMWTVEELGE